MSKKRNYWPLLFIAIFTFTLGMIIYTVVSAIKTPVNEDKTFLQSYHKIDANFNKIMEANDSFVKKYDFVIYINDKSFPLSTQDLFYSQRVLEKKPLHQNLLKKGVNFFRIEVKDKISKQNISFDLNFRVTKATNNTSDMDFSEKNVKKYKTEVNIPIEGNWNITGKVQIKDKNIGSFYIKTNAI